jgi:ferrous iron transport protein A
MKEAGRFRFQSEQPQRGEKSMKTLRECAVGETVVVAKITGEGALRRRMMDMGITKGTEVTIRKVAPLGDPIEVTVRGYELSIRRSEAEQIQIQ